MNVVEVIESICPKSNIIIGKYVEYDVESKRISILDPNSENLASLITAAHEAFHCLRHKTGLPFYKDLESGIYSWNEEALEEEIINDLTEEWCLNNLPFSVRSIKKYINEIRKQSIKYSPGFVSKYL